VIEDTVAYALLKAMKSTRGSISPVLAERRLHPGQDLLLSALWPPDIGPSTGISLTDRRTPDRSTARSAAPNAMSDLTR
jgi:hypothetical protein